MLNPKMSLVETLVVHPVSVVECRAVPVAIAGLADAVIELLTVGMAVPVAIFHTSTVIVPVSTVAFQAWRVQAYGAVIYTLVPVTSADPCPSNVAPT